MTKNLYFRTLHGRNNYARAFFYSFFMLCASYPRLLLEVFIRKDFGERYFNLASVFTVAFILTVIPFTGFSFRPRSFELTDFLLRYLTWYVFLIAFIVFSLRRSREIKRNPSVFDFARFSLYGGTVSPFFLKMRPRQRQSDLRIIPILYEPAPFFLGGLLLLLFGQAVGGLLVVCSIFYSLGYKAETIAGDNFIMNKIDEIILNEELEKAFVDDADPDETRGVRVTARRPADPEMRRKLMSMMIEKEEQIYEAQ